MLHVYDKATTGEFSFGPVCSDCCVSVQVWCGFVCCELGLLYHCYVDFVGANKVSKFSNFGVKTICIPLEDSETACWSAVIRLVFFVWGFRNRQGGWVGTLRAAFLA